MGMTDDMIAEEIADIAESIIKFAKNQLEKFQPRDDYKELFHLTIIFLGGTLPRGAFASRPQLDFIVPDGWRRQSMP